MSEHGLKRTEQSRSRGAQLIPMRNGKQSQKLVGATRQPQRHPSRVVLARRAANPTLRFETIDEFYRRVVPDLQTLGQGANGDLPSQAASLDGQKRLMLLRLDAGRARRFFAEIQKAANFVAQVGKRLVIDRFAMRFTHFQNYIV